MQFPKVVLALGLIAGGLLLPVVGRLDPPDRDVIGMSHDGYVVNGIVEDEEAEEAGLVPEIVIHVGDSLSFQNNSRWIHIIGPGRRGVLAPAGAAAISPRRLMEQNARYTTPPWTTPGTYLITCSVHPDMDAKVVVLP